MVVILQLVGPGFTFISEETTREASFQGVTWKAMAPEGFGTRTIKTSIGDKTVQSVKSEFAAGSSLVAESMCNSEENFQTAGEVLMYPDITIDDDKVISVRVSDAMRAVRSGDGSATLTVYLAPKDDPTIKSYLIANTLTTSSLGSTAEVGAGSVTLVTGRDYWTLQTGDRFASMATDKIDKSRDYRLVFETYCATGPGDNGYGNAMHSIDAFFVEPRSDAAIAAPLPVPQPVSTGTETAPVLPYDPSGADTPASEKLESFADRVVQPSFYQTFAGILLIAGAILLLAGLAL